MRFGQRLFIKKDQAEQYILYRVFQHLQNLTRKKKMNLLNWNHKKVQSLSPLEIWLFIIGRIFVGFGAGVLAMRYYPQSVNGSGFPILTLGCLLLAVAAKGLRQKNSPSSQGEIGR